MKILEITPTFYPSKFGGIKTVSYTLSKKLVLRGHQVTVFTTDADMGYSRLTDVQSSQYVDGIDVRYFRNISNLLAWKCRLFLPLGMSWTIKKEIHNFDIIHLHDFRNFSSILIHRYAKKNGIPYIIQAHGSLPIDIGNKRFKQIFDFFWGYSILQDATKIIASTADESTQYVEMGVSEDKIEIIPNGFDLSELSTPVEDGSFRKKYGIESTQKIILFLGRINKIKGIDLLIESFFEVIKEIPNCILVIVGPDDGYLSVLNKQIDKLKIQNKIIFTGTIVNTEKYEVYYDADVYVLPSTYECFSITILEAWACGTPVILTNTCALSSIAQQAGIVVKHNPIDMATAIKKLILDKTLRKKYCEMGKSLVNNEFNIETVVTNIEECYRQVIENVKWREKQ